MKDYIPVYLVLMSNWESIGWIDLPGPICQCCRKQIEKSNNLNYSTLFFSF